MNDRIQIDGLDDYVDFDYEIPLWKRVIINILFVFMFIWMPHAFQQVSYIAYIY